MYDTSSMRPADAWKKGHKNMKRKIISILLVLVMVVSLLPATAFAAGETKTLGDIIDEVSGTYTFNDAVDGGNYTLTLNEVMFTFEMMSPNGALKIVVDETGEMSYETLVFNEDGTPDYDKGSVVSRDVTIDMLLASDIEITKEDETTSDIIIPEGSYFSDTKVGPFYFYSKVNDKTQKVCIAGVELTRRNLTLRDIIDEVGSTYVYSDTETGVTSTLMLDADMFGFEILSARLASKTVINHDCAMSYETYTFKEDGKPDYDRGYSISQAVTIDMLLTSAVTITEEDASIGSYGLTIPKGSYSSYIFSVGQFYFYDKEGNQTNKTCFVDREYERVTPSADEYNSDYSSFTDVSDGTYYADAVKWAVENEITNGTSPTTFSPKDALTRAQAVTFLWRAAGSPEVEKAEVKFTDVKAGSYYEKAVAWAVSEGITNGMTETTFSPNEKVTRGQIVTFLWREEGSPVVNYAMNMTDVNEDKWYTEAVRWALFEGITNGKGETTFGTIDNCTRADAVTFIYRLMNK